MPKTERFRKGTSDRSGFDDLRKNLVKDKSSLVRSDERDDPPPSKLSLGGEGEISQGSYFRSSTSTAIDSDKENPTFYITAAGGITPNYDHPYMRVTGSGGAVTITANPRIAVGVEGRVLTLFCTDSSITIQNGQGVATMGSQNLRLDSGSIAVFMYNTGDTAWKETSRVHSTQGIGG